MPVVGSCIVAVLILTATATSAFASPPPGPEWARDAIRYLDKSGYLNRDDVRPNRPMRSKAFKAVMRKAFGRSYLRSTSRRVSAGEVSKALVTALGKDEIARDLVDARSPDGWDPATPDYFGTEILAREIELRHDRPTSEDKYEASAVEPLRQADVAWAVWKAKTDPSLSAADALAGFDLPRYTGRRREVVEYAFSLVGTPYVWAGEWATGTPAGYPYGAQVHGGFDCSGFVWNVLRAKTSDWRPEGRPYKGWVLQERSSAAMAAAAKKRLRFGSLRPGDVLFFAPDGRKSKPSSVFHASVYLGRGWMIHSSGSRAGVSIAAVSPGSWWHGEFAWGRRIID